MTTLKLVYTTLIRTERLTSKLSCQYESRITTFTISDNFTINDVLDLHSLILEEQTTRWSGNLLPDETHTRTVKLKERRVRRLLSKFLRRHRLSRYRRITLPHPLKSFLRKFNEIARNESLWLENNPYPPENVSTYNVEDSLLNELTICGIHGRCDEPLTDLWSLLNLENPCSPGRVLTPQCSIDTLHIDSQSLYTFPDVSLRPRLRLFKCGGWLGGPVRKPGRPRKKQERIKPKHYPNPLRNIDISSFPKKFHTILNFCKQHSLNPIPIAPRSKQPLISWSYLLTSPIRPEHLNLFKNPNINIGIVSPYNNIAFIDIDIDYPILNDIYTTTVKTARGYHYYFFLDDLRPYKFPTKDFDLTLRVNGYVLAPPSIHPSGFKYRFLKLLPPLRISREQLISIINDRI